MAYGLIKDGVLLGKQPNDQEGFVEIPDDAVCGQITTDGGKTFANPPLPPPVVPDSVEAWQAKKALISSGHYTLVEGAIAALGDDPESLAVKVDWACAKTFRRDWPALVSLAKVIGLDDDDLDALFLHAETL